jgi:hypothetical protein
MTPTEQRLPIFMQAQPDETTCGPTCLAAVYRYFGETDTLPQVIARTRQLERGGTFAVFLAVDALRKGFEATLYTCNLLVFDPSWFEGEIDIAERLRLQMQHKKDPRLALATEGYLEFIERGGRLKLVDLTRSLIRGLLQKNLPIITGLSSTFLYRTAREFGPMDTPDDIRGYPAGHFVVIAGYQREDRSLLVADPYGPNPFGGQHEYWVSIDRVIGAVLLGIVTHDANLLVIERANHNASRHRHPASA